MGKCSSKSKVKEDPSTSYISAESEEEAIIQTLRPLHSGPIHALCAAQSAHLISGGADEVGVCIIQKTTPQGVFYHHLKPSALSYQQLVIYEWSRHVVKRVYKVPSKEVTEVAWTQC